MRAVGEGRKQATRDLGAGGREASGSEGDERRGAAQPGSGSDDENA
jgi:hypothetical protein